MLESLNPIEIPQTHISIRKANQEDIPFIKECLADSWTSHAKHEPNLLDEERMRQSDVEGYYSPAMTDNHIHILIAEFERQVAGFIRADEQTIPAFFRYNKILFIDDLYVLQEFRNQGVAKILIQEVEKIARDQGIKRIQARVYSYNKPTQTLLESLSFHSPHATWDKVL
jgi:GNAT superfamily N-acetyltransferase